MHKYGLLFISILIATSVSAQEIHRIGGSGSRQRDGVTAIAIKSEVDLGDDVSMKVSGQEVVVPKDPDAPLYRYFISLNEPTKEGMIAFPVIKGTIIYLISSGMPPKIFQENKRDSQEDCDQDLSVIDQSEWRSGLTAPSYSRSFTEVSHVVVHHSAGSNTATNFTQVVRDIYLYHTKVNGWSDIGYNYLVAQNGAIYAGRDPGSGDQDNVLGAHFCGSNSKTMGICVLGNYETTQPTSDALSSLVQLCVYKLKKEGLNPFEEYGHAFGSLGAIIGHRDGCSTLCPGENIYSQLADIRDRTDDQMNGCVRTLDFDITEHNPDTGEEVFIRNTSSGYSHFQWIFSEGDPDTAFWQGDGEVSYQLPGEHDIMLIGFYENGSDTLYRRNAISVTSPPILFPNPVMAGENFHISSFEPLKSIAAYSVSGKRMPIGVISGDTFTIPGLQRGVYLLRITTEQESYVRKLYIK